MTGRELLTQPEQRRKQRELSSQYEAVRKREQRRRKREERQRLALVPEVPTVASTPPVPPAPPPAPTVTHEAAPAPAATLRVSLLETKLVTGDGPDAYAAPLLLGAGDDGAGGVPLVDEAPPPPEAPRPPVTREKAAIVGKIVKAYVGFGWGVLVHEHTDKLAAIADSVMRGHPELDKLSPEQKWQLGLAIMLGQVEESAIQLCVKYNIAIPYFDEAVVGASVGTATLGVFKAFGPRNENERVREAKDANPPASSRDVPPPARDVAAEVVDEPPVRTARAANRGVS